MPVNQRLKEFIKSINTNPTALGNEIGISQSSMKKIVSGEHLPSSKVLIPLLEHHSDLNINWLLTGQGEMIIDKTTIEKLSEKDKMIALLENTVQLQKESIEAKEAIIKELENKQ